MNSSIQFNKVMKQFILIVFLVLLFVSANAQLSTEVVLFDLSQKGGKIIATNGTNISKHAGYDNQPFFHPNKNVLYYTSDEANNTDIKQYDIKTRKTSLVTSTPEREFSPTITPDGQNISCIIQRENGAQDLGKYPIGGGPASIIVNKLVVGYHAWLDEQTLFLFVLGDPSTLRRFDIRTNRDTVLATQIGRSLHRVPATSAVSFVQKSADNNWAINQVDANGSVTNLCATLPGREDLAWMGKGWLLMSDGTTVFACQPGKSSWTPIELKSNVPLKNISRLAVNASGTKLAIVTEE
jgi:hypothetical protein